MGFVASDKPWRGDEWIHRAGTALWESTTGRAARPKHTRVRWSICEWGWRNSAANQYSL